MDIKREVDFILARKKEGAEILITDLYKKIIKLEKENEQLKIMNNKKNDGSFLEQHKKIEKLKFVNTEICLFKLKDVFELRQETIKLLKVTHKEESFENIIECIKYLDVQIKECLVLL